jgi:hypothetical protein
MTGCIECGAPTPNRTCRGCRLAERAAEAAADQDVGLYDCPTCEGLSSSESVPCYKCRSDGQEIATDGGVLIAGVEYVCRTCETTRTVYVRPRLDDDGVPTIDLDSTHRLVTTDCDNCGTARTHVARQHLEADTVDQGEGVATDGGERDGDWYETEWKITCLDCDFSDELTRKGHPRDGPHEDVEERVTQHKHTTDDSHIVRVEGRRADRDEDIDPSILTDGGAPLTHTKPTERRDRANSHFCDAIGARRYCLKQDCDLCADDEEVDGLLTDGGRERKFEPEDHVLVENLNGERKDAVVVGYHDTTAGEHELFADDPDRSTTTLARYWGDVDADEPVVAIRYAKGVSWDGRVQTWSVQTYDFPESAIVKLETDGGLSDSLEEFADPRTDDDVLCRRCGDEVPRRFLVDGLCIGCRERGDGPGASAHLAGDDDLLTDGGCRYTRPTGPGYEGTHAVGASSVEVNLVSVGLDRGAEIVSVAQHRNETPVVRLQRPQDIDVGENVLHRADVNNDGFYTVSRAAQDHLGVTAGDDVRLYADGNGWVVVAAATDPFVDPTDRLATDGGEFASEFCANCTARVDREDRVVVDGQIYHRQCAPDSGAYDTEVPR